MSTGTEIATVQGELIETTSVAQLVGAEIDSQISTAKMYPRDIRQFMNDCETLACIDEDVADSMFYVVPRAGKKIVGPSVRMAEIVAHSWGNLRTDRRIVSTEGNFATAQATCIDLQRNVSATKETKRKIVNKYGKRFNDDMIQTTCNAAMAVAFRDAVFSVVPLSFFKKAYEAAKNKAAGNANELEMRRQRMIEWFVKQGADEDEVFRYLGYSELNQIKRDDLIVLKAIASKVKETGMSVKAAFEVSDEKASVSAEAHKAAAAKKRTEESKEKEVEQEETVENQGDDTKSEPVDLSQEDVMLEELRSSLKRKKTRKGVEEARAEFMEKASDQDQFDLIHELCDIRMSQIDEN